MKQGENAWEPGAIPQGPILRRPDSLFQNGERVSPGFVDRIAMPFQKPEDTASLGLQVMRLKQDRSDARLRKIQ